MKSIKSVKRIGSQKPDGPTAAAAGLQQYCAEHSWHGKNKKDATVLKKVTINKQ